MSSPEQSGRERFRDPWVEQSLLKAFPENSLRDVLDRVDARVVPLLRPSWHEPAAAFERKAIGDFVERLSRPYLEKFPSETKNLSFAMINPRVCLEQGPGNLLNVQIIGFFECLHNSGERYAMANELAGGEKPGFYKSKYALGELVSIFDGIRISRVNVFSEAGFYDAMCSVANGESPAQQWLVASLNKIAAARDVRVDHLALDMEGMGGSLGFVDGSKVKFSYRLTHDGWPYIVQS